MHVCINKCLFWCWCCEGGTEAPLTPLSFAGFCNLMAMNTVFNDRPTLASRPFDLNRGGFVMSEGAGVLVLETLSHAVKRGACMGSMPPPHPCSRTNVSPRTGARVYCELAGYGASCDAYHITSPDPEVWWTQGTVCYITLQNPLYSSASTRMEWLCIVKNSLLSFSMHVLNAVK